MKNQFVRYLLLCLSFALGGVVASAQDDTLSAAAGDRYVITAKAGGVNLVEGTVTVVRKREKSGLLLRGDMLDVGDRVSTSENGKAEILLNPGSFLRLGGNSTFEFNTTSLDNLELKLDSGSAIFEVFAADEFKVSVATPVAIYSLIKSGVYRIDVSGNGEATIRVWKGAAKVGTDYEVNPGRSAVATGSNSISVAKFDRDTKDSLDVWSKSRSKELAKLSASLRGEGFRRTLMQGFQGGRWNFENSFGLWIYDPLSRGYCFFPFGYRWSSPYGYGYGHGMSWWWDMPMNSPMNTPTSTGGGASTGGGSTPPASTPIRTAGDRLPTPPFIRMEQVNGGGIRGGSGGRGDTSSDSGPSYTPSNSSSSSSPAPSSPPPSQPSSKDDSGKKP
ncbi:MAG: FecR family protein [Acidobacteriota bacterium]